MKNPWTLKITVKEKTRVGCVKSGKKYSYFDQTELVVNETEVKDSKIPVVSGLKIKKNTEKILKINRKLTENQ